MVEPELTAATILVADDNWANLELLSQLLQDQGYRVVCVVDGEQAIEALLSEQIDLTLLEEVKRGWWDGSILKEFEAVVHGYEPVQTGKVR